MKAVHWIHSVTVKLVVVFIIATLAVVVTLEWLLDVAFEHQVSDSIQPYFTQHLTSLKAQLGMPPDVELAKRLAVANGLTIEIQSPTRHWSSSGDFFNATQLDAPQQCASDSDALCQAGIERNHLVLRIIDQGYTISFIVAREIQAPHFYEACNVILATILILSALYAVIYWLFRPVKIIESGIKRIGEGDVSYRLDIRRRDELGSLATSINKTAQNIEQMLTAKRQLLLAISHELRSPITRSKLALSMLDDSATKDSLSEDIDEMEALIHELLETELLQSNHAALTLGRVDINHLIYQLQARFFEEAPLVLDLAPNLPTLTLDPGRMSLAIKNVINNALKASVSPTDKVIISTAADDTHVTIVVEDVGCGIPTAEISRLTEPFYRPDSSRQRKTGGVGIGLYLIKTIVDAHRGELRIDSAVNQGTTVSLRLPISCQRRTLLV